MVRRFSSSSLAGIVRTEVAVGTPSECLHVLGDPGGDPAQRRGILGGLGARPGSGPPRLASRARPRPSRLGLGRRSAGFGSGLGRVVLEELPPRLAHRLGVLEIRRYISSTSHWLGPKRSVSSCRSSAISVRSCCLCGLKGTSPLPTSAPRGVELRSPTGEPKEGSSVHSGHHGQDRRCRRLQAAERPVEGRAHADAKGFLGSTSGTTADGKFITVARFESEELARQNSDDDRQSAVVGRDREDTSTDVEVPRSPDVGFVEERRLRTTPASSR